MKAYYPRAYYCSKAVFEKGGWKACRAEAGGGDDDDEWACYGPYGVPD
jgi:hypothetical protein